MELIKTANGKKRIKLSRKEWTKMGRKAGWLDKNNEKSIEEFIEENREKLINIIKSHCSNCSIDSDRIDSDSEIEKWIKNEEGLYNWAKEEGVDF